jgi:sigma-B regulation protein RsbU (phosphoserine phosphatase)
MFNLSLKYKVMVLLTVVPLLLLASYLFLVIRVFESDKIAYIYDTNSSVNRSIASQARGVYLSILSSVKPILQEHFTNGDFGILSREIFRGDNNLLFVGIIKIKNNVATIEDHIEKDKEHYNDVIKDMGNLSIILNGIKGESRFVRTPFRNNNILLVETFENPLDKSLTHFSIVFQSQELSDLFSVTAKQRFFLATENGEILFQNSSDASKNGNATLLDSKFFRQVKTKKAAEGTELIKSDKTTFLASYNKIGFGNLLVTSMVDQKKALSAIKILVTKSLLFAGLLLCITLLFSIIGSQSVTQALRDLLQATQRIAQGDFTSRVFVKSKDEIGSLARSFNLMSQEVGRLMNETAEKARMEGELQTARTVQETLFPPNFQAFDEVQIAGHYEPASECGGDWWYYAKINNKIIFCIGDATGHGAPAALITSAARSAASILENFNLDANQVMRLLNKAIYDVSKGQVMMTFFLGILNLDNSTFTYCNASHEPPFYLKGDVPNPRKKDLIPLMEVNNSRLGQDPTTIYDQSQIKMDSDDFILFYTDGIADIRNPQGESLGERDFLKVVVKSLSARKQPQQFVALMNSSLEEFRADTGLIDDVTFFCIKYGKAS